MVDSPHVRVSRTSPVTADVTGAVLEGETVLRDGIRRRIVFQPELVDNPTNSHEAVRGYLWYQTKRDNDSWGTAQAVPLNTIKTGENVRIELQAAAVHKLYRCLTALYGHMATTGLTSGTTRLVPIGVAPGVTTLVDKLNQFDDPATAIAALDWLGAREPDELTTILQENDRLADSLTAAAAIARLRSFVTEAESELDSDDESRWSDLISRNTWTISQLYASPVVFFKKQAYLGGKSINNEGGNFADFIFINQLSGNVTIVEIKTPKAPLISTVSKYVRNNSYPCSMDVAGGVQQTLQYLHTLQENYPVLRPDSTGLRIFRPRLLLIVGNMNTIKHDDAYLRSFELFRGNLRDLDIITFDELVEKARALVALLTGH